MREQEEKGSAKMRGGEDGDGGEALAVEQGSGAEWPTRSENFEQRKGGMEEEGEREMAGKADNNNGNDSMIVSPKEICRTLARGQSLTPLLYLETMDGEIEEVERDVALLSPLVQREVHRHGRGVARTMPVVLPKQVSPGALKLILDYCRFHRVPGRSDKERKVFDEKFVRLDTRRLCELTSAADSLDMKPLGDLTSRALARMIEGKTPEQIREIFHLPDDLTEEEKLEPVKISTDDPRIRLLNRLYARKRKELQEKKLLKSGLMECTEKQIRDERSVEDLVSFIDGDNKNSRLSKGKRKKNRRKKEQSDDSLTFRSCNNPVEAVDEKCEHKMATARSNTRARGPATALEHRVLSRDQDKVFEEGDFDDDDGLDPALKEIVDREVEDFARRLNSDWLKRTQEILTLASSSQEQRHSENFTLPQVSDSNTGDSVDSHMGNGTNGNLLCNLSEDKRILQQQEKEDRGVSIFGLV